MGRKPRNPELEEKLKVEQSAETITPADDPVNMPPEKPKRIRRTREQIEAEKTAKVFVQEPNPIFMFGVKIPCEVIYSGAKKKCEQWDDVLAVLEQIRMTDAESYPIALSLTQLANYYFPNIPEIAYTWCNLILAVCTVGKSKIDIINQVAKMVKERTKTNEPKPSENTQTTATGENVPS